MENQMTQMNPYPCFIRVHLWLHLYWDATNAMFQHLLTQKSIPTFASPSGWFSANFDSRSGSRSGQAYLCITCIKCITTFFHNLFRSRNLTVSTAVRETVPGCINGPFLFSTATSPAAENTCSDRRL